MRTRTGIVAAGLALVALTGTLGVQVLNAQQAAFKRTILQRGDISVPGREAVTAQADIPAGVRVGRHTHPGEEVGYVLEGTLVLEVEGKPPVTLKAGDTFLVEAGRPHDGTNEGKTTTKVLATYIVEKGKPLATPVP
jgi:quercetin dioxygenase-like cupin family protein